MRDRWFEVLLGVLFLPFALLFLAAAVAGAWSFAFGSADEVHNWGLGGLAVASGLVGSWCAQMSWRLFSGRERRGGGLLSPAVLMLVAMGCVTGALAMGFHDVMNLGWLRIMALGFWCFGFALYRWRRRHGSPTRSRKSVSEDGLRFPDNL